MRMDDLIKAFDSGESVVVLCNSRAQARKICSGIKDVLLNMEKDVLYQARPRQNTFVLRNMDSGGVGGTLQFVTVERELNERPLRGYSHYVDAQNLV